MRRVVGRLRHGALRRAWSTWADAVRLATTSAEVQAALRAALAQQQAEHARLAAETKAAAEAAEAERLAGAC